MKSLAVFICVLGVVGLAVSVNRLKAAATPDSAYAAAMAGVAILTVTILSMALFLLRHWQILALPA
jgi:hypothetical protein